MFKQQGKDIVNLANTVNSLLFRQPGQHRNSIPPVLKTLFQGFSLQFNQFFPGHKLHLRIGHIEELKWIFDKCRSRLLPSLIRSWL